MTERLKGLEPSTFCMARIRPGVDWFWTAELESLNRAWIYVLGCAMHSPFAVPIASLTLVTVGCGAPDTVSRSEVEQRTREGLTKSVGKQAPAAKCPKPLKAQVGATTRCTMDFPDRKRLGISVKVTEVTDNGKRVRLDFEADQALTNIE